MALSLNGLPIISQLSQGDQILVATPEGLKTLSAEVLGEVFSDTSLFDNRSIIESAEINVQNISTHNKLRKYFDSDTSTELYLEYKEGQVNFLKDTVIFDINTNNPVVVQATDLRGNKLYWNFDPDTAEFADGLPWKTKKDERVTVTTEVTDYPVKIYQYTTSYIKKQEITFDMLGEPTIVDTYLSKGQTSKGVIKKEDNSFVIQLEERGKEVCGLRISLNEDGTVSGKLMGTWDGVNDWDLDDVVMKDEFKKWFYTNQDYNTYVNLLSVNTADKIGWYLQKDTSNHVYTEVNENVIKVFLAQNKQSGSGTFIQEQAQNTLGQPLYWKQDMTYQSGVSSNHIPVYNGEYTFMTTKVTDYPVFIYQYTITELFSVDVSNLKEDNGRGARITFTGLNGKRAEIYRTLTQFILKYVSPNGTEYSKILMGETESSLVGNWKIGDRVLDESELPPQILDSKDRILHSKDNSLSWEVPVNELPEQPNDDVNRVLYSKNKELTWRTPEKELPEQPEGTTDKVLTSNNKNLSWKVVQKELPEQINDGIPRMLSSNNNHLSWDEIQKELPEQIGDDVDRIIVSRNNQLSWVKLEDLIPSATPDDDSGVDEGTDDTTG